MPKKSAGWVKLSGYLFLLGIIISIIAGIFKASLMEYEASIHSLLVIFGVIIGLLGAAGMGTIDRTDTQIFLLAVVALIAAGGSGSILSEIPTIGPYLASIVGYIAALVMPAAVIIALEAIWKAGSTKF
ncbi:MAG: hypothetical protein QXK49_02070 [Candidatus Aenigmatarchaeota archaeon]